MIVNYATRPPGRGGAPRQAPRGGEVGPRIALAERPNPRHKAVPQRLDGDALGVGEEHGDLVAVEARRDVSGAHRVLDGGGDVAEELVALEVAALVVEVLEVVDVEVGDADRRGVAAGAHQLLREPL